MLKSTPTPMIGASLYAQLSELCEAARTAATTARNLHAAALYLVLEAPRVQAEHAGTHVAVYIQPVGGK
jgi:hypothetical protein